MCRQLLWSRQTYILDVSVWHCKRSSQSCGRCRWGLAFPFQSCRTRTEHMGETVKARGILSLHLSHCASRDGLAILADRAQGNQALSAESTLIINKVMITSILEAWYDASGKVWRGALSSAVLAAVTGSPTSDCRILGRALPSSYLSTHITVKPTSAWPEMDICSRMLPACLTDPFRQQS